MEVKPGYKRTEVGVIPEEWEIQKCREVCERIVVGVVIRPKQYYRPFGIPAFRSANIHEDGINDLDLVYFSESSNAILAKSQTRSGDVLTVRTGYPGTSAVVRPRHAGCNCIDILISRPIAVVLDSDFLALWINSSFGKEQVLRNQGGLAQKHFNVGDLKNLVVALPSLPEQKVVVNAMRDINALLAALDQLIAKKRDLKQAAMQQLLTGQTRLPGFDGEWEEKRIGEFTDCTAGGTPSTKVPSYWGGSIRWMSSGELNLKRVGEVAGRITEEGLRNSSTQMIPSKCVLIGLAGQGRTRGTVAINLIELCTNQSIAAIFPAPAFVPEYLYYYLDTRYDELRDLSSGDGGRGGLNLRLIKSLRVPLPILAEQTAIANVLTEMDADLATLELRREKTRALKQAMMQELLTGRTRLV